MEINIFHLPIIYCYLDETNLILLKRVNKEFYEIIQHMVDNYNMKATKITFGSMFSGTINLAIYAYTYHINSKLKTFMKRDFTKKLIKYGNINVLKYFIKKKIVSTLSARSFQKDVYSNTPLYYVDAVNNGIDMLRYIHEQEACHDRHGEAVACSEAGRLGKLECLQYLHINGFGWDYLTTYNAAWYGHIDCLKYAIENGCEWDYEHAEMCDNGNNSVCMKYYEEHILANIPVEVPNEALPYRHFPVYNSNNECC